MGIFIDDNKKTSIADLKEFYSVFYVQQIVFAEKGIPPEWQYVHDENNIPLSHQIINETSSLDVHKYDYPVKSLKILDKRKSLIKSKNVYVENIYTVLEKISNERLDVNKYIMVSESLPTSEGKMANDVFKKFYDTYVARFWPNIKPRDVALIMHRITSEKLKGFHKSYESEINDFMNDIDFRRNEVSKLYIREKQMNAVVEKYTKLDEIIVDSLQIKIHTNKNDENTNLFVIFRRLKTDSFMPFIKIRNPEKKSRDNLIKMTKALKDDGKKVSKWVQSNPKGLNIKLFDKDYIDVSLGVNGILTFRCGKDQSRFSCLKLINKLIDKINREAGTFLDAPTKQNTDVSLLQMNTAYKKTLDRNSIVNHILGNYEDYFSTSSRIDELKNQLTYVKKESEKYKHIEAAIRTLGKESGIRFTYKNEFSDVEDDVSIVIEKQGVFARLYSHDYGSGVELLLRTISVIKEIGDVKHAVTIRKAVSETGNYLDLLRQKDEELFTKSGYGVKCQKDKQPLVWTEDEFKTLDPSTYTYGLKYRNNWYTCRKDLKHKYPGFQEYGDYFDITGINSSGNEVVLSKNLSRKNVNKFVEKFQKANKYKNVKAVENERKGNLAWPCCFTKEREIDAGKFLGKKPVESNVLITTDKVLDSNRISNKIPEFLHPIFKKEENWHRFGTNIGNSFWNAVFLAVDKDFRDERDKEPLIESKKNEIIESIKEPFYNTLNNGQLSKNYSLEEYKKLISAKNVDIEFIHDLLSKKLNVNIYVFSIRNNNLICGLSKYKANNNSIFLISQPANRFETIFKDKEFVFKNKTSEIVHKLWELNCPKIVENTLEKLNKEIKLSAQIKNHRGNVIYAVVKSSNVIIPVVESAPIELPSVKLDSAKLTATNTYDKLNKLDDQFHVISQVVLNGKTIGLILKNGSIVPTKNSKPILMLPVEKNIDFADNLDAFINKETFVKNAQTKFTRKDSYRREMLERVRYDLADTFKHNPDILKSIKGSFNDRKKLEKLLRTLVPIIKTDRSGRIREIDADDIPERKVCRYHKSKDMCTSDPFCSFKDGQCALSLNVYDRKRILYRIAAELYRMGDASEIVKGTVPFSYKTFILRPDEVIFYNAESALKYLA